MTYSLLKKILFLCGPEETHDFAKKAGQLIPKNILAAITHFQSPRLQARLGSIPLDSPVGLAAGFDKNGEMISLMSALGFGFLEIGSVTLHPCEGNPKPRLFRLPRDESLINRLGLPNWGAEAVARQLSRLQPTVPVGINIAKTPDLDLTVTDKKNERDGVEEILSTFQRMSSVGNYFVFNLSCPNTKDGKTFEETVHFKALAEGIMSLKKSKRIDKPLLVKLSPDLTINNLHRLVDLVLRYDFDGLVLSNSTLQRPPAKTDGSQVQKIGEGGLTGRALQPIVDRQIGEVSRMVEGKRIIVGVGGIMGVADLLTKLALGATLVQVYTGLVYGGPLFVKRLKAGLDAWCQKEGVKSYRELVGQRDLPGLPTS